MDLITHGAFGHMDRQTFIRKMKAVLSPSQAITEPDLLRGRAKQFKETKDALEMPGRQVFICGLRGVGKSSLALTTAMELAGATSRAAIPTIQCWRDATFGELIRDLCNNFLDTSPLARSDKTGLGGKVDLKVVSAGGNSERTADSRFGEPASVNEAAENLRWVAAQTGKRVAIIDEFDLLTESNAHEPLAQLVKKFADSDVDLKLMFCGVGESANELMHGHTSAFRYFHTINLDRLPIGPRLEIVEGAAKALGIEIERNSVVRVAQICDGFPYFAHLVTEKLLWEWFNDEGRNPGRTEPRHYEAAIQRASEESEPELKDPYDKVVKRYKTTGEHIIWSIADGPNLDKNIDLAYRDYLGIMDRVHGETLTRDQFNGRLIQMRSEAFGEILASKRRGWYEFSEKRMRGYARLRAARQGELLRSDNPLA